MNGDVYKCTRRVHVHLYCKCNAIEFCANACQCSTITHNNRCSFKLSTYSPHVPSLYAALPPPVAASRAMALTTLEDVLAVKQTLALWSSSCACSCTVARVASFSSRTCSTITSYGSTSSYRPASDMFQCETGTKIGGVRLRPTQHLGASIAQLVRAHA